MRRVLVLLFASVAFGGEWEAVQRIPAEQKVEIRTRDGARTRGAFVSATADAVTLREKSGDRLVTRAEIRELRVADPSRRVRTGLISTAIGAAAGWGIGFAVCPHCANEGAPYKYIGPGIAIGSGVGALGFLSVPYRTVYKTK